MRTVGFAALLFAVAIFFWSLYERNSCAFFFVIWYKWVRHTHKHNLSLFHTAHFHFLGETRAQNVCFSVFAHSCVKNKRQKKTQKKTQMSSRAKQEDGCHTHKDEKKKRANTREKCWLRQKTTKKEEKTHKLRWRRRIKNRKHVNLRAR